MPARGLILTPDTFTILLHDVNKNPKAHIIITSIMKTIKQIIKQVQVNIPFTMLYESYLETFIEYGLNPEIGLDAAALDRFSMADFSGIAEKIHKNSRSVTLHGPFIDLSAGSPDVSGSGCAQGNPPAPGTVAGPGPAV